MFIKRVNIRGFEIGMKFRNGEFQGLLGPGVHWLIDPLKKTEVRIASTRDPWISEEQLDVMVKSGMLAGKAEVVDLKDDQRALVWIDGRLASLIGPEIGRAHV